MPRKRDPRRKTKARKAKQDQVKPFEPPKVAIIGHGGPSMATLAQMIGSVSRMSNQNDPS